MWLAYIKKFFTLLGKNWGIVALVAAAFFLMMWNSAASERDAQQERADKYQQQLIKQEQDQKKLEEKNSEIEYRLYEAINDLASNTCGVEEVPSYLLEAQRRILKGEQQ